MTSLAHWRRCLPDPLPRFLVAIFALCLTLAWPGATGTNAQANCGNYAITFAHQPAGHPLSDNAITWQLPDGTVTSTTFKQPQTVQPTPKPGIALARSLGGQHALLDVRDGTVTPLNIPEGVQPQLSITGPTIRNAPESNFVLMASAMGAVWLVDLSSGDALDLSRAQGDPKPVDSAQISPDGKWLLYSTGNEGFLVSLEQPGNPIPIDTEALLPHPSFDANSDVVYAVGTGDDAVVRKLEPVSEMRSEIAKTLGVEAIPVQAGDPWLLVDGRSLSILRNGASAPTEVFEWASRPGLVFMNLAGTHLLVSDERDDASVWDWVDLENGQSREIDELAGMYPVAAQTRADALFFAPEPRIGPGVPGAAYRTFDLSSGTVSLPLEQDSDDVYQAMPAGDRDGRYVVVDAVRPGSGRVWLVDNTTGSATMIGSSSGNATASVSPDGCQLAVSIFDTLGEGRTSTVVVSSMLDGETTQLELDALQLGWVQLGAG